MTVEEAVRECGRAWARAREWINAGMSDNDVYGALMEEFRALNETYPMILVAMSCGDYSRKVARSFFEHVRAHPWTTEAEFTEVQSAYTGMLYRNMRARRGAHTGAADVVAARDHAAAAMRKAQRETRDAVKAAQDRAAAIIAEHARARASDLISRIGADAPILTRGEVRPITVSFEDDE